MKNITLRNNKLLFVVILLILLIIIIEYSPLTSAEDNTKTENNIIPIIKCNKDQAEVNETIVFDASQSYINNGTITKYLWHFGDGSSLSSNKITNHKYGEAGKYTVILSIYDSNNNYNYIQKTIHIQEAGLLEESEQNKGSFFQIGNIINFIEQNPILPFLLFLLILIVIVLAIIKRKHKNKSKNKQSSEEFSSKNEGVYKIENFNNIVKPKVKREDGLEIKTNVKPTTADFKQDEKEKIDVFKSSKKENIKQNREKINDFDSTESFDKINKESKNFNSTETEFEKVEDSKTKIRDRIGTSGLMKQFEFSSLTDDENDDLKMKSDEKDKKIEGNNLKENSKNSKTKNTHNVHSTSQHRRLKTRRPLKGKVSVNQKDENESTENKSDNIVDSKVDSKSSSNKSKIVSRVEKKGFEAKKSGGIKKKSMHHSIRSKRLNVKKRKSRSSEKSSLSHRKHRSHVSRKNRLKHAGVSC